MPVVHVRFSGVSSVWELSRRLLAGAIRRLWDVAWKAEGRGFREQSCGCGKDSGDRSPKFCCPGPQTLRGLGRDVRGRSP